MLIIGRITRDAQVNNVKGDRKVVNFSIAQNDSYKPKDGERVQLTTYFNCSYWRSEKIAEQLKKGALVEVEGRLSADAYTGKDGTVKASLNCHVNTIKIHAWPKDSEAKATVQEPVTADAGADDDLPF